MTTIDKEYEQNGKGKEPRHEQIGKGLYVEGHIISVRDYHVENEF